MKMHKKKEFLEELRKMPIIEKACDKVGISRMTYYRWIDSNTSFKKEVGLAISMGVDRIDDVSDSKLFQSMNEGDLRALIYWKEKHSIKIRNRANKLQGIDSDISIDEAIIRAEKNILEKMLSGDIHESKYLLENNDERYLKPQKAKMLNERIQKDKERKNGEIEREEVDKMIIMFSRFAGMESILDEPHLQHLKALKYANQTPPPQTVASSAEQPDSPSQAE